MRDKQAIQETVPRWVRDVLRFVPLKSQFVVTGNIRDQFPLELVPGRYQLTTIVPYLATLLQRSGYRRFIRYDPTHGFSVPQILGLNVEAEREWFSKFNLAFNERGYAPATFERFSEMLECMVRADGEPIALFADFSSRFLLRPDHLTEIENRCFTRALLQSHEALPKSFGSQESTFYNTVFWIADKEGDLPDWFVVGNPKIRQITVPRPDHIIRRTVASTLLKSVPKGTEEMNEFEAQLRRFVEGTEGLLVMDLAAIVQLSQTEHLDTSQIDEAVRRFKLGVTEDPWRKIDRLKLKGGEEFLRNRIKGQEHAIIRTLDIIKRAVSGLSDRKPGGGRPRGVAFLAGPTGVGKTELAKTITSLLFGDESAYIRFDMSEFSAEHSDQRLIGAPPGYVGYDVGGELTNAIREKPFSVVLFDEIEKAHPRILDKFLQVLDDGVLTSGRGERVYFSEAFIIFTSNLGIYKLTTAGERVPNVSPSDSYEVVAKQVRDEIERHFKVVLGRPEILNRIGENLIVFDFIRKDTAEQIFTGMVENILAQVKSANSVDVVLAEKALEQLKEICLKDLGNGGRGIRNQLEAHFINPLARLLFALEPQQGTKVCIGDVRTDKVTELVHLYGGQAP